MRRIFRRGLQTAQSVHSIHYIKKVPFEKNCNFELLPSRLKINIISNSYKRTLPMKECDEKSKKELAFELVVHVPPYYTHLLEQCAVRRARRYLSHKRYIVNHMSHLCGDVGVM